jgi:feruloyl esterase
VEASAEGGTGRGALPPLPAHCVVRGVIAPRSGVDGRRYETRFELRLPTAWTNRFFYQGGGGNDGTVGAAVGRNTGSFPETALQRGFAVVSTDAGHQGAGPEFGLDPDARIDHAYRAHDRTAVAAKAIVARYYGRAPSKSYFVGCSGGGRQGMMFSQRFPDYFDGIVICAPAMSVSSGATIAAAWDTAAYFSIAPENGSGQRILSQAFSLTDLDLVSRAVLSACDGDDGVVDRMVQRAGRCAFDPAVLQCLGTKTDRCLNASQVAALVRTFNGPVAKSGKRLYVGQAWDPGISAPGWRQWKLGTSEAGTRTPPTQR